MATVTGIGTLFSGCPCCGCIHLGCCSLLGDTIISPVLTVSIDFKDSGTISPYDCNFPALIPFPAIRDFVRALYPIGGLGVAFFVTYVADPMSLDFGKWVGTYTACDGTTVIVKYYVDSSNLSDCVWILNVFNPDYSIAQGLDPANPIVSRLRHFSPGIGADGCDGYPFYWSIKIDGPTDVFPDTGLFATAYDTPLDSGGPCTVPPPPLPSWNCVAVVCVDPGDGTGTYPTLAACEAECFLPTWNCVDGSCVDPDDGSGTYSTLELCEAACFPVTYNCVESVCVDPGDGTGTYSTLEDCIAAPCDPPPSWNCVVDTCTDPGDGTGVYSTLEACEAECPPTPPVTYDCVDDTCVDPGDGSGAYATLELCESNCPPVPTDCPTVLAAAPDTLYLTTSSTCASVDGLAVTVSRTSSTTFAGTASVADCGGCNTVSVNVSCSGDTYVVTTDWTGSEFGACEEEGELPVDCLVDSSTVVSTTPLVITGTHCFGAMGTGPCCPAGHFDWVLSETPP
jgi:hypothetical protein